MDGIITEKNYPIRRIWIFKQIIAVAVVLLFMGLSIPSVYIFMGGDIKVSLSDITAFLVVFLPNLGIIALMIGIPAIATSLQRSNFHYSFEEKFIVLHQGVISKQNRNIQYGFIQGVFLYQTFFDRMFGLTALTFEDFSQGGVSTMDTDGYVRSGKSRTEAIGFVGNKVHIPGLKKEDAEALKTILLQKIKENPIDDGQSGL